MAGASDGECQLRDIVNIEDSFRAPIPPDRPSQLDPKAKSQVKTLSRKADGAENFKRRSTECNQSLRICGD